VASGNITAQRFTKYMLEVPRNVMKFHVAITFLLRESCSLNSDRIDHEFADNLNLSSWVTTIGLHGIRE